MIRTYTDLKKLEDFESRFNYLKLNGEVGADTFGFDRFLNQKFYNSKLWKKIRDEVIFRDNGCDLGMEGYPILHGPIMIHHMNPIKVEDVVDMTEYLTNTDYLICTSRDTHNAIHYGNDNVKRPEVITRTRNDMCPWKH